MDSDPTIYLSSFGTPTRLPKLADNEELGDFYSETIAKLERVVAHGREQLEEIAADTRYSAEGKVEERRMVGSLVRGATAKPLEEARKSLRRAIDVSESRLFPPQLRHKLPPGRDPEDVRWTERESRDLLRGKDPLELRELYLGACRSGNTEVVRVFELGPAIDPLLPPEVFEAGRNAFAQQLDAEAFALWEEQRHTAEMLRFAEEQLEASVDEIFGAPAANGDGPEPEKLPGSSSM